MKIYQVYRYRTTVDLGGEYESEKTAVASFENEDDANAFKEKYGQSGYGNQLYVEEMELVFHNEFNLDQDYGYHYRPWDSKTDINEFTQEDIDWIRKDTGMELDEYLKFRETTREIYNVLSYDSQDVYGLCMSIANMEGIQNVECYIQHQDTDNSPYYSSTAFYGSGDSVTIFFENGTGIKIENIQDYVNFEDEKAYLVTPLVVENGISIEMGEGKTFGFDEIGENGAMINYLRELVYEKNIEDVASKIEQTDEIQTATKSHETIEPISEQEKYKLIKDIEGDSTILSDFIKDYAVNYVQTSENSAKITFENGVGVYIAGDRFIPYEIKDDKEQPIIAGYFSPRGSDGVNGLYAVLRHSEDGRIYNYQDNSDIEFFEKTQIDLETFAGKAKEYSKINEMFSSSAADIVSTVEPFAKDIIYRNKEIGIVMESDTGNRELLILSSNDGECTISRAAKNENGKLEIVSSNTTSIYDTNAITELIKSEHKNFIDKYSEEIIVNTAETIEKATTNSTTHESEKDIPFDKYQLLNEIDKTGRLIEFVHENAIKYDEYNGHIDIVFDNDSAVHIYKDHIVPYWSDDTAGTLKEIKVSEMSSDEILEFLGNIREKGAFAYSEPSEIDALYENPVHVYARAMNPEVFDVGERLLGNDMAKLSSFIFENDLNIEFSTSSEIPKLNIILSKDENGENKELLHIHSKDGYYTAFRGDYDLVSGVHTPGDLFVKDGSREDIQALVDEVIANFEASKNKSVQNDSNVSDDLVTGQTTSNNELHTISNVNTLLELRDLIDKLNNVDETTNISVNAEAESINNNPINNYLASRGIEEYSKASELVEIIYNNCGKDWEKISDSLIQHNFQFSNNNKGDIVISNGEHECVIRFGENGAAWMDIDSPNGAYTIKCSNLESAFSVIGKEFPVDYSKEINGSDYVPFIEGKTVQLGNEIVLNDNYKILNQIDNTGKLGEFVDNYALGYEEKFNQVRITFENGSGVYLGENHVIPYTIRDGQEYAATLQTIKINEETTESLLNILKTVERDGAGIATSPVEQEVFKDTPVNLYERAHNSEFFDIGEKILGGDVAKLYAFALEHDLPTEIYSGNNGIGIDITLRERNDEGISELLHIQSKDSQVTMYHCAANGSSIEAIYEEHSVFGVDSATAAQTMDKIIDYFEKAYEEERQESLKSEDVVSVEKDDCCLEF